MYNDQQCLQMKLLDKEKYSAEIFSFLSPYKTFQIQLLKWVSGYLGFKTTLVKDYYLTEGQSELKGKISPLYPHLASQGELGKRSVPCGGLNCYTAKCTIGMAE